MGLVINSYGFGSHTARTSAYQTATGSANTALLNALDTLDLYFISKGLDSIVKALHIYLNGSTVNKFNFMNPADTDAAFRLTFNGGNTHGANGWTPNGTTGYADSHFNPTTNASVNGFSFGIYSRTNSTSGTQVYGCIDGAGNNTCQNNLSNGNFYNGSVASALTYTANPSTRMLLSRRSSSTSHQAYRDGTSLGTSLGSESALAPFNFYFGARNSNGTANLFCTHEHVVSFLGLGMTNQNALDLTTGINNFATTMGVNV